MVDNTAGVIESKTDYEDTPSGQYKYWDEELKNSQKSRRKWHKQGNKIVKRYLDDRTEGGYMGNESRDSTRAPFRLNLFHSNIKTVCSMMYGNIPKVDVSRAYADADDDVARVAAMALERMLNADIAENTHDYDTVLRSTLLDRLLPGLGCARLRYSFEETDTGLVESAPAEYFYWGDVLWGWARNWNELPWLAYRSYLTKDEVTQLWGEDVAEELDYKKQSPNSDKDSAGVNDPDMASAWQKTEIWEVWDKTKRKVIYINLGSGYNKVLETKDDPLGLKNFFPSPPFLMANPTTSLYTPTPDFNMAQDLYNEIDALQTRIAILTTAVKAVGVYDSSADGIQRMFNEGVDNTLIPVENWALFGEKGGIKGSVDWVPIEAVVNTLTELGQLLDKTIAMLYQITGMSDIMRGSSDQYKGVGQVGMEAKMGSVRIQSLQDEFADFASSLMQLKAEIICRHFDPETIVAQANLMSIMPQDQELIMPALQLLKNPTAMQFKTKIRPESVAMQDFAQLKSDRTEYINAIAVFFQSAGPIMETDPAAKPFFYQLLQWGLAGFKGSSEIEGVIDAAIEQSQKQAEEGANDKPDPEQVKAQAAMQLEQMKQQGAQQSIQMKAQADMEIRQQDLQADKDTALNAHYIKLAEIQAETQGALAETTAKMEADLAVERAKLQTNMISTAATVQGEQQKDVLTANLDIEKAAAQTALKITEISASAKAKIAEAKAKPKPGASSDSDGDD